MMTATTECAGTALSGQMIIARTAQTRSFVYVAPAMMIITAMNAAAAISTTMWIPAERAAITKSVRIAPLIWAITALNAASVSGILMKKICALNVKNALTA